MRQKYIYQVTHVQYLLTALEDETQHKCVILFCFMAFFIFYFMPREYRIQLCTYSWFMDNSLTLFYNFYLIKKKKNIILFCM